MYAYRKKYVLFVRKQFIIASNINLGYKQGPWEEGERREGD